MIKENPFRKPKIEKVVVNIGVGEGGKELGKAEELLKKITERKAARTLSKHKIPTWNLRKRQPIGCKVTLRKKAAEEFLKKAFQAKENTLSPKNFDELGNFSFGIGEYIDFPGMKYDPEIGIMGMDVCVSLERPGFRVKRRRIKRAKIPQKALIKKEESIDFIKEKFGVKIE